MRSGLKTILLETGLPQTLTPLFVEMLEADRLLR